MRREQRLYFLDNLRTFLIFLVVLLHAGLVYESAGIAATFWIVDDPSTSDLPGLVNLLVDIFIMPTIFFISGFLAPPSLEAKGSVRFLRAKARRLLGPWAIAVFALIPLYKVVFLYSRGLPQEHWTTYFHFSNGIWGMNWLWFLPALFLFDVLFVVARRLGIPRPSMSVAEAVQWAFWLGFGYSVTWSASGWSGWTHTWLVDFQNERALVYFLVFLVGAVCYRRGVLASVPRSRRMYFAVSATAWIPVNVYVVVVLNYFLRPGQYLISPSGDRLMLWFAFHVSMWALLYLAIQTFRLWFDRQGRLGGALSGASYGVYIVHMAVMGPIALMLLRTDLPALLKYPVLAMATWGASNLLVVGYRTMIRSLRTARRPAASSVTVPGT